MESQLWRKPTPAAFIRALEIEPRSWNDFTDREGTRFEDSFFFLPSRNGTEWSKVVKKKKRKRKKKIKIKQLEPKKKRKQSIVNIKV